MSRSYRKPFAAICGYVSCKRDKQFASRAYRRLANRTLHIDEEYIIPHRYEAKHNDRWSWVSDGKSHYIPSFPKHSYFGRWVVPEWSEIVQAHMEYRDKISRK